METNLHSIVDEKIIEQTRKNFTEIAVVDFSKTAA